jgi:hypothetical protein
MKRMRATQTEPLKPDGEHELAEEKERRIERDRPEYRRQKETLVRERERERTRRERDETTKGNRGDRGRSGDDDLATAFMAFVAIGWKRHCTAWHGTAR